MGGSGTSSYSPRASFPPVPDGDDAETSTGGVGGASGGGSSDPCASLTFRAYLQSLQDEPASSLQVGEELDVAAVPLTEFDSDADVDGPVPIVQVARSDGAVVGTLADQLAVLLPCLEHGTPFVAEVVTVEGGAVLVRVHASE